MPFLNKRCFESAGVQAMRYSPIPQTDVKQIIFFEFNRIS